MGAGASKRLKINQTFQRFSEKSSLEEIYSLEKISDDIYSEQCFQTI